MIVCNDSGVGGGGESGSGGGDKDSGDDKLKVTVMFTIYGR
jgi:hypothetical protein